MNPNQITDFLNKQNVFAVVGVSKDPAKYGHQVYVDLKEAGYVVYAVNPNIDEVLGEHWYHWAEGDAAHLLGEIYLAAGDKVRAREWLEKAVACRKEISDTKVEESERILKGL